MYKFINEHRIEKFKKGFVIIDNRIYANPTEETLRKAGYKELVTSDIPEYNPETHYASKSYVDGDVITEVWQVYEMPPIEDIVDEITE